ncbi:MAG: YciI family protein [Acidimicrobiales bacterium]|nr:YciI family protein [Acidimicrobiales bacterium]
MKYACLIYDDESTGPTDPTSPEFAEMIAGYMAFGEKYESVIQGGEALDSVSTSTCVKVRDGKMTTTDGPFAETKEQLGGFYIIEADDLDTACQIASEIPGAYTGQVEVRPVPNYG